MHMCTCTHVVCILYVLVIIMYVGTHVYTYIYNMVYMYICIPRTCTVEGTCEHFELSDLRAVKRGI